MAGSDEAGLVGRRVETRSWAEERPCCGGYQQLIVLEFVVRMVLLVSAFVVAVLMLLTSASAAEYAAPTVIAAIGAIVRLGPLHRGNHHNDKSA